MEGELIKRLTGIALSALVLTLAGTVAPVGAGARPSLPEILGAKWTTAPVRVGGEEILEVHAVDPDGIIVQLDVLWGDGVFTHADLICFGMGEVAKVRLGHEYTRPGRVFARVIAISSSRCFGPSEQETPTERVPTRVYRRPGSLPSAS